MDFAWNRFCKVINLMTNVTALVSFLWIGAIDFPKAAGAGRLWVRTVLRLQPGRSAIDQTCFALATFTLVGKLLDYFSANVLGIVSWLVQAIGTLRSGVLPGRGDRNSQG